MASSAWGVGAAVREILTLALAAVIGVAVLTVTWLALDAAGVNASIFGGDKGSVLVPLFLGLPLGTVMGVWSTNGKGNQRLGFATFGVGVGAGLGSAYITVALMDLFGFLAIIGAPLFAGAMGYAGLSLCSARPKPTE